MINTTQENNIEPLYVVYHHITTQRNTTQHIIIQNNSKSNTKSKPVLCCCCCCCCCCPFRLNKENGQFRTTILTTYSKLCCPCSLAPREKAGQRKLFLCLEGKGALYQSYILVWLHIFYIDFLSIFLVICIIISL